MDGYSRPQGCVGRMGSASFPAFLIIVTVLKYHSSLLLQLTELLCFFYFLSFFYVLRSKFNDLGQKVVGLSISMFHRLLVNFNFGCNFWTIQGTLAIFNIHFPGSKHIQYAMNVDYFMTVMHLLWITPLEPYQLL